MNTGAKYSAGKKSVGIGVIYTRRRNVAKLKKGKSMGSYNRTILVGNLTRDPELRYIPSGTAVTDIGLAINDKRKDASGKFVDETTFVDVTLWGRTAEVAGEYLSKGSPVLIEGRLKLDTWETDGQKRSKLKVVGERLSMLGAKPQQNNEYSQPETQTSGETGAIAAPGLTSGNDIPF